MLIDDAVRLVATTALQQCVTNKMATEKKAAMAHSRVRAIALLLKEELAFSTTLEAEATMATLQLAPPPPSSGGDTVVVAMLHVSACEVQNTRSLVSIVLDPSSTCYARWHDQVLLTLKCYELTDHVLSDSWIFGMITGELQDIIKEHGVTVCQIWHMIDH
jgi:hypothetical protein